MTGTGNCTKYFFGTDPAYGVIKSCQVQTVAPAPAPAPTTATATLGWSASTSPTVTGYRVYYGLASNSYMQAAGTGLNASNGTSYVVTGLKSKTLYYFALTSVDAAGNESIFSNEVSKLTP